MSGLVLLCAILAAAPRQAPGPPVGLRIATIFGDHMVLQQHARVPVFGSAPPGAEVSVSASFLANPARTVADAGGRFRVDLDTPGAGGPHALAVRCGGDRVEFRDVWLGEVWLASGQSNMEMPVGYLRPGYTGVLDHEAELERADHPRMRLFEVENTAAEAPRADCEGSWRVATRDSVARFSATAYFFGRELLGELDVPIGLIAADWGGTVCEAWMSREGLLSFSEFRDSLESLDLLFRDPRGERARYQRELAAWWARLDGADPPPQSADPHVPDGASMGLPSPWTGTALEGHDGVAWFEREVDVPPALAHADLELQLGPLDDMDTVFWNGAAVGATREMGLWREPRRYVVPGRLVAAGQNRLLVRVVDTGGEGGLTGRALRAEPLAPLGPPIDLAGRWRWKKGPSIERIGAPPRPRQVDRNDPTALYNGMIAPLAPFRIRGAIWYQGESNRLRHRQYLRLFPALIADWRRSFEQPDLPFLYVQIAPFAYRGDRGEAGALRDAQRLALRIPHTGMAVTMDIGDESDIHPRNKQEVGRRLSLLALARVYGRDVACSGPLYRGIRIEGSRIRVEFDHADGLHADGPLDCFEVAGEDRAFHPAKARIDGETIVVWSDAEPEPVAVRFAFGAADSSRLFNAAGLPASSFRSDDWPIGG